MEKILLILPGSADPEHKDEKTDYRQRYELVASEAKRLGYTKTSMLVWPGQRSGPPGIKNLRTAGSALAETLSEFEKAKVAYDIIAFSWGANVCLSTLFCSPEPKYLGRTVLWGIDEFWRMAGYFSSPDLIERTVTGITWFKKQYSIKDCTRGGSCSNYS